MFVYFRSDRMLGFEGMEERWGQEWIRSDNLIRSGWRGGSAFMPPPGPETLVFLTCWRQTVGALTAFHRKVPQKMQPNWPKINEEINF